METECCLAARKMASPGRRREMIFGSPRRMGETVLVTPGSSRNWGGREGEGVGEREKWEDLRSSKFLAAIGLNLSRRRTLE